MKPRMITIPGIDHEINADEMVIGVDKYGFYITHPEHQNFMLSITHYHNMGGEDIAMTFIYTMVLDGVYELRSWDNRDYALRIEKVLNDIMGVDHANDAIEWCDIEKLPEYMRVVCFHIEQMNNVWIHHLCEEFDNSDNPTISEEFYHYIAQAEYDYIYEYPFTHYLYEWQKTHRDITKGIKYSCLPDFDSGFIPESERS